MTKFIATLGFIIIFSHPLLAQNNILATTNSNNTSTISCQYYPEITATSTTINPGETVDLSIVYTPPPICNINITPTNIPLGTPIPGFTFGGVFNGHYYYIYTTPTTWTQGELICRQNGGYLVCINDLNENTFVSNLTNSNIWIGMFRDPSTCQFRWLNCMNSTFTNWRPGEPNADPCGEPYTHILSVCGGGLNQWNNLPENGTLGPCFTNMIPIMEIDPLINDTLINTTTSYLWSTGATTSNITVTPTVTANYWVDITSNSVTCRKEITITVNIIPAPTANTIQFFCNSGTIANLQATGIAVKWYTSAIGGNHLTTTTALVNGSIYYVSQTVNGYESATRLPVTVKLNNLQAPTGAAIQILCNSATVADLQAAGTSIQWYAVSIGGTPLATATALVNGTIYHASQTVNGCESATRLPVTVTINNVQAPTGAAIQTLCNSATVANLRAIGTAVTWHTAATGGTPLATATALVNRSTYYASQTIKDCESVTRLPVTALINTLQAPSGLSIQTFCNSATVENLQATGANIQWYSSAMEERPLAKTITLVNRSTYYASQTINGCESKRMEVIVHINETLSPTAADEQTFCLEKGATVADILTDNANSLLWFDAAIGGNILPERALLQDGEIVFAANYNPISDCYSARKSIKVLLVPCKIEINNLLTLNGNDDNSQLNIKNVSYFPKNQLQIYNRYGKQVWSGTNYNNRTNTFIGKSNVSGVYKRQEYLPTGTYYYVFTYFNEYMNINQESEGFIYINNNQ